MDEHHPPKTTTSTTEVHQAASHWVRILAHYRTASTRRSIAELAVTAIPFAFLLALSVRTLSVSHWLAGCIAAVNGLFLVRLFMIQHDCGHGAFFPSRAANTWTGRVLSVLTLTPYDSWRHSHSVHHSAVGDLDKRGMGDVTTLTVLEYRSRSSLGKLAYKIYRNPFFLFGVAPALLFFLQYRLPSYPTQASSREWISTMATNLAIFGVFGAAVAFSGVAQVATVFVPSALVGASIGVWIFYVQHQFEETYWQRRPAWTIHDAALRGSSHYVLPPVLRWFSANIGMHHVHHLCSRIPFYRLAEAIKDHPDLDGINRLTLVESLECARRHLWDERRQKLVTFSEAQFD